MRYVKNNFFDGSRQVGLQGVTLDFDDEPKLTGCSGIFAGCLRCSDRLMGRQARCHPPSFGHSAVPDQDGEALVIRRSSHCVLTSKSYAPMQMPYILGFAMFMIACGIALPKATGESSRSSRFKEYRLTPRSHLRIRLDLLHLLLGRSRRSCGLVHLGSRRYSIPCRR